MATFADIAILLMAFFVLILSFAEMNVPKFKQINGSLKNSFGVQRIIPVVESPKGVSIIARNFTPSITEPTPLNTVKQESTEERKIEPEIKTDDGPGSEQPSEAAKAAAKEVAKALATEVASGQVEVSTDNGKVVVTVNQTPSAAQSGASGTAGTQTGGASTRGANTGGSVAQDTIDLYAKVAQAQATVDTQVEVRDTSGAGSSASAGGGTGSADKAQTDNEFARIRKELAKEIEAGKAEVERDGARIIIRLAEQGSFTSGSADLQRGFTNVLNSVGKSIADSQGRIYIEGHTDNVPVVFNDRFKSNWDLSGARSGAVADYLTGRAGVTEGRMSVSGYADTRPIDSNDTAAGRSRNRRIEVIIDGGG